MTTNLPRIDLNISRFVRCDSVLGRPSVEKIACTNVRPVSRVKERSGLAAAAGFTGLALIFSRFSLAPLLWAQFPGILDVSKPDEAFLSTLFFLSIPLPGLIAPVALWLGAKAWSTLDGNSDNCSRIQAGFAFLIGLVGTVILIMEIYQVTKALMTPI